MKQLRQLIGAVEPQSVTGFTDAIVQGVACHPDQVTGRGFLFVCMDEYLEYNRWQTWRTHLETLAGLNLSAIIAPERIDGLTVPQLIVNSPRQALGRVARLLFDKPDEHLSLIGVTGTNGKTTTVRLVAHLLSRLDKKCGSIGTLGISLGETFQLPGTYTTPLAPDVYRHLAHFRDEGAQAVSMEVSSHALALDRVEGLSFDGAILTNVERDHLDFHGTQAAYAEAKSRLFTKVKPEGRCVFNQHSAYWENFAKHASGQVLTFGQVGSGADFEVSGMDLYPDHSVFIIRHGGQSVRFTSLLAGSFQVENTLAAVSLVGAFGYPLEEIALALKDFPPVTGRMEQIPLPNGAMAIVDYAHNPDGLRHLLNACRPFCRGCLRVVFGCGGDRDKGKRPIMGEIASQLADDLWVTSDNPRTEDPSVILKDILDGIPATQASVQADGDRASAIARAYAASGPDDVLVIAGKGHEDYQIIGHTKHFFSDQAVLRDLARQSG